MQIPGFKHGRPFLLAGITGIAVILTGLAMQFVNPQTVFKLPDGFRSPIVALEFIRTQEEIADFFGPDRGRAAQYVEQIENGTLLDFLYLLLYPTFLLFFTATIYILSRNRFFLRLGFTTPLIALADALENGMIFRITQFVKGELASEGITSSLLLLQLFTWIKWSLLLVVIWILTRYIRKLHLLGRIIHEVSFLAVMAALAAIFWRGYAHEIFVLLILITFLGMIVFSLVYKAGEEGKR